MSKDLEETLTFKAVFIPSHLTKGLVAGGVSMAAAGVSIVAGAYAIRQFSQVRTEEVVAMIKPPR